LHSIASGERTHDLGCATRRADSVADTVAVMLEVAAGTVGDAGGGVRKPRGVVT